MIDYVKRLAGPYTGAGLKTFSFSFKIFEETDVYVATSSSDLEAAVNLSYGTDYSVSMNADQDAAPGGSVTLTNGLAAGQILVIGSALAYTQETQLTNFSRFPPEIINTALDRIVVQIQQIVEALDRTVKVPATSSTTPERLVAELMAAQEEASEYAVAAAASAAAAKASEDQTAEYAEAATVILPYKDEIASVAETVVPAIDEVKTVAENIDAVKTDASIADEIVTVAGIKLEVKNVSEHSDDVEVVSAQAQNVKLVASDFTGSIELPNGHDFGVWGTDDQASASAPTGGNIAKVAGAIDDVQTLAGNSDILVENMDAILKDASIADEIVTVAGIKSNVNTVAQHAPTITQNIDSIVTVSGSIDDVSTTAADIDSVVTVAENIDKVKDAAGVVTDLNSSIARVEAAASTVQANQQGALDAAEEAAASATAAAASADTATQKAEAAGTSASQAANSATSASGSATTATSQATAATQAKTLAQSAQTAAESAKTAAQAAQAAAEDAAESVTAAIAGVYHYRGSVATADALPDDAVSGDVYNVEADGMNYAWTGLIWDALGGTVDLSAYLTKASADSTYVKQTAIIAISKGGTGATTAAGARTALGLGSMAVRDVDFGTWSAS